MPVHDQRIRVVNTWNSLVKTVISAKESSRGDLD